MTSLAAEPQHPVTDQGAIPGIAVPCRPRHVRTAASLLVVLLPALSGSTVGWAQARARLIHSVDIQVPVPPLPVRIAGKRHLAYELQITNFSTADVALTRVEVLNADDKASLGDFRDADLTTRLARPGARPDPPDKRVIGGGMRAAMFLWLALDDADPGPRKLRHRIAFDVIRADGREHGIVEVGSDVRAEAPVVLDPPLRGGPWVALYDPLMARGHRTSIYAIDGRARIPARFAIEWIRMESDATHARGDESRVANWHGYGAEVLAVANGSVAEAKDDIPEEATLSNGPSAPVALENASGNYVSLDLGEGRHAIYEHLQHGSVRVKKGDRVRSGQVLGRLGNSGSSSSGPHLHFHVSDGASTLAAEGLPYVFRRFEVVGAFETIGAFAGGERWRSAPGAAGGTRTLELPAANTVVMFGSDEGNTSR